MDESERKLFGFGQNNEGQLGIGDTNSRLLPTLAKTARGLDVVLVVTGDETTALLTSDGEVFCCGKNDNGQCGLGTTRQCLGYERVDDSNFKDKVVKDVVMANGSEFLLLVTDSGNLFGCGANMRGQLAQPLAHSRLCRAELLMPRKVIKVACHTSHAVAVCDECRVWAWGSNSHGQLGWDSEDISVKELPSEIESLRGQEVAALACGRDHTIVAVTKGSFYGFGRNTDGQLGFHGTEFSSTPTKPEGFDETITQVACGVFHTLVLTDEGEVYAFGHNRFGQLGLGNRNCRRTAPPHLITDLRHKNIVQVACGGFHSLTLDEEGRVYPFGRNQFGQLGTGTTEDSCRPVFVEALSDFFVCQIAAGFHDSMCIIGPALEGRKLKKRATLRSDLRSIVNNPVNADVTFLVEGRRVHGHRCILSARCEPMRCMLSGSMREASTECRDIAMPGHRHDVFLAFLEFLYTDKVATLEASLSSLTSSPSTLDIHFVMDLRDIADEYLVDQLKWLCDRTLLANVTVENVSGMLLAADVRDCSALRSHCMDFICVHWDKVRGATEWGLLPAGIKSAVQRRIEQDDPSR